jgi:hypothetical protein
MKKSTVFKLSLIAAVCGLLILQSCEKDPVTPPVDNTSSVKPYIMVKGFKYYCAKQRELTVDNYVGDTLLQWIGTGFDDTMLSIIHMANDIKVGTYKFDSTIAAEKGFITGAIRWGTINNAPNLNLVSGNYEIKRENGKFVSYLKNGEAYNGLNHKDRYYNIEFKVVWPY